MKTVIPRSDYIEDVSGILLVNKPRGKTSFSLVACLRRILKVKKIGHAGTLDPFATGLMVMLVGRQYTRLSDQFLTGDKEYVARLHLGIVTDSFDCDGNIMSESSHIPSLNEVEKAIQLFQGEMDQVPPMFSAKKINGKKLYELARKGKTVDRMPVKINIETRLLSYEYPHLDIHVRCSKGTYIRSIAHDLGFILGCGAHLIGLERQRSGQFCLSESIEGTLLFDHGIDASVLQQSLRKEV